jgi:hypothetical protein
MLELGFSLFLNDCVSSFPVPFPTGDLSDIIFSGINLLLPVIDTPIPPEPISI